jgi:hypothetical protein
MMALQGLRAKFQVAWARTFHSHTLNPRRLKRKEVRSQIGRGRYSNLIATGTVLQSALRVAGRVRRQHPNKGPTRLVMAADSDTDCTARLPPAVEELHSSEPILNHVPPRLIRGGKGKNAKKPHRNDVVRKFSRLFSKVY